MREIFAIYGKQELPAYETAPMGLIITPHCVNYSQSTYYSFAGFRCAPSAAGCRLSAFPCVRT